MASIKNKTPSQLVREPLLQAETLRATAEEWEITVCPYAQKCKGSRDPETFDTRCSGHYQSKPCFELREYAAEIKERRTA